MPRYFIDTSDQDSFDRDEYGLDFDDLDAAKAAAVAVLPDMARDILPDGDFRIFTATVRDEDGATLLRATLELSVAYAPDEEREG